MNVIGAPSTFRCIEPGVVEEKNYFDNQCQTEALVVMELHKGVCTVHPANGLYFIVDWSNNDGCGASRIVTDIVFDGDYETVVGRNKAIFLKECSLQFKPVRCFDVKPGSIIVTLEGTEEEVALAADTALNHGLHLPSFETLQIVEIDACIDNLCGANSNCTDKSGPLNTVSGRSCACKSGYSGDPEVQCTIDTSENLSP
eukprot:UN22812